MLKKYIIIFLISLILTGIVTKILTKILVKIKAEQTVLKYVVEHFDKNGTPTMGGIGFILVSCLVFLLTKNTGTISKVAMLIFIFYGIIGFLDDFIKIKFAKNDGLTPLQKIIFQLVVACISVGFCFYMGITKVYIPFTNKLIDLGYWFIPFGIIVFLSTTNCVNLTDGLDGLAGTVSFLFLLFIGIIIYLETESFGNYYLNKDEYLGLSTLSISISGGLIGFLLLNVNKAKVFMGDTGSLGLGGVMSAVTLFSCNPLYIPIIGIMFVVSGISVIVQVLHFKRTKKRVFIMAPIHHHFQHKGATEAKIVFWYGVITLILGLVSLLTFL